jgi:hypothetical protein
MLIPILNVLLSISSYVVEPHWDPTHWLFTGDRREPINEEPVGALMDYRATEALSSLLQRDGALCCVTRAPCTWERAGTRKHLSVRQ